MTQELPADVQRAFDGNDAMEPHEEGFEVTTTVFDALVSVPAVEDSPLYRVEVRAPTLDAATEDDVADVVALDWFETLERRLEEAPKATRMDVPLERFEAVERDQRVYVTYEFTRANPRTAVDVAKTFVEYVEGTYAEGVIPGYEYTSPVADLLSSASQGGESGTPL